MTRVLLSRALPFLPLLVGGAMWEAVSRVGGIPSYLLPPPSQVIAAMGEQRGALLVGLAQTAGASLAGLLLSFVAGSLIAMALSLWDWARRAFYPYAVFFQTVPIVAIAPLLVIWFGFGLPTVVASAFIVSIFPIVANTLVGLQSTDPLLEDLFRLYSRSRWARLFKLKIPYALPQIFSGLRIGAGLAVIGAVVGEFIAGGGLGSVVDAARTQQRTDLVFAAVLLSAAVGLALTAGVGLAAGRMLRGWHVSAR